MPSHADPAPSLPRRSRRQLLADGLKAAGLQHLLLRVPSWRGVAVLSYHRIGDPRQSDLHRGLFSATAEAFDRQLQLLSRYFRIIGPDQLEGHVRECAGRAVMITFDDGYRDFHTAALPVLEANKVKATVFLCSGLIDGTAGAWWDEIAWMLHHSPVGILPPGSWAPEPIILDESGVERAINLATHRYWARPAGAEADFLDELAEAAGSGRRPQESARADWITWAMAREIRAAGHHLGAHTMTHPILAQLPRERQREEIAGSAERIADELGQRPRWLAYPVGTRQTFTADTGEVARQIGIELAFSNYGGYVTRGTFASSDVRRLAAEPLRTDSLFAGTLALPQVFGRVNS